MLNERINFLKAELVAYASLVENMISKGISGVLHQDRGLLEEVIQHDEPRANRFELVIDDRCTALIAQFQPKAKNLRTILMILKMNNDLERLGDLAVNICQSGLELIQRPQFRTGNDLLRKMKEEALGMLRDSINAFVKEDMNLTKKIVKSDSIVDDLRDKMLDMMTDYMKEHSDSINECIQVIRISRNIERVADLSTNLAEDVVYMVEGKVIKHPGIQAEDKAAAEKKEDLPKSE